MPKNKNPGTNGDRGQRSSALSLLPLSAFAPAYRHGPFVLTMPDETVVFENGTGATLEAFFSSADDDLSREAALRFRAISRWRLRLAIDHTREVRCE